MVVQGPRPQPHSLAFAALGFRLLSHLVDVDLPVRKALIVSPKRIDDVLLRSRRCMGGRQGPSSVRSASSVAEAWPPWCGPGNRPLAPRDLYAGRGRGPGHQRQQVRAADERSTALHRLIMKYADSFLVRTARLAGGRAQRGRGAPGAMAADGVRSPQERWASALTHEFLALMLAARPGALRARAGAWRPDHRGAARSLFSTARPWRRTQRRLRSTTDWGPLASTRVARVSPQLAVGSDKRSASVLTQVDEPKRRGLNLQVAAEEGSSHRQHHDPEHQQRAP